MVELRNPVFSYRETAWLDSLPAYNPNPLSEQMLDSLRKIQESGSYYFQANGVPDPDHMVVAAFDSFEDEISVPPGSILTMVTAYSATSAQGIDDGFKAQIYDKGSKTTLFAATFGKNQAIFDNIGLDIYGNPYMGPHILASPFVVLWPGQVNIEIRNMASVANTIQLALFFAIPVTQKSIGNLEVRPIS